MSDEDDDVKIAAIVPAYPGFFIIGLQGYGVEADGSISCNGTTWTAPIVAWRIDETGEAIPVSTDWEANNSWLAEINSGRPWTGTLEPSGEVRLRGLSYETAEEYVSDQMRRLRRFADQMAPAAQTEPA